MGLILFDSQLMGNHHNLCFEVKVTWRVDSHESRKKILVLYYQTTFMVLPPRLPARYCQGPLFVRRVKWQIKGDSGKSYTNNKLWYLERKLHSPKRLTHTASLWLAYHTFISNLWSIILNLLYTFHTRPHQLICHIFT